MDPASLLAAMEDDFQRERQRVEAVGRWTVTREIGHGLGTVTVDGHGHLRSIAVDREAFHLTNEAALARKIVEAVNLVEDEAARRREGDGR
jgi:DNA-binding protein YbaB